MGNHHKINNTEKDATDQIKETIQKIRNNSDHYNIYLFTFDNYLQFYVRFYYIISTQNDIQEWLITRHHHKVMPNNIGYLDIDDNDIFIKNLKSNIVLGFDKDGIENITNGQINSFIGRDPKRNFKETNMVTIQQVKTILNTPTKSKYLQYQKLLLKSRFKCTDYSLASRDKKYEKDYFPDRSSCNLL